MEMEMEMRERRWEEMDVTCLARIFARVGIEDKLLSLPFVCKSWSMASSDPFCWRSIDFSSSFRPSWYFARRFRRQYRGSRLTMSGLLKLALHRSQGSTTELFLPRLGFNMHYYDADGEGDIHQQDMELVEKLCRRIKVFSFAPIIWDKPERIPRMVANWENLETLCFVSGIHHCFEETLAAVNEHCPRFGCLMIMETPFDKVKVEAVVTLLPRLKRLALVQALVWKDCLMSVLDRCKELEELRVEDCRSNTVLPDEDVMKRAAAAAVRIFVYESPRDDVVVYNDGIDCLIEHVYDGSSDDGLEL